MERFEQTGKSVDDAVRAVEERIGRPLRQEEYRIVDVGSRGVLGLIGAKPAVLEVWLRGGGVTAGIGEGTPVGESAVSSAETLLRHMGLGAHATTSVQEDCLQVDLEMSEEDGGILIGRRGATLDAFQHVVRRMVERQAGEPVAVVVDVGGYRERRRDALVQRALRIADQVKRSGRQVTLDPMPPGERRAVHMALKPDKGISTYSVGQEPDRKVVIAAADGGRARPKRRPERESGGEPRDAARREREFPHRDAHQEEGGFAEDPGQFSTPSERPSAIEEVALPETMAYGRRRLYRRPRNRPIKPPPNGLNSD